MAKEREPRDAAMLLTSLVIGGDEQLDVFRRRRAADPEIDLEHLRHGRELLLAVYHAIKSEDSRVWRRIDRAWEVLNEPEREPEREPEAPPPEPSDEASSAPAPPARVGEPGSAGEVVVPRPSSASASPWGRAPVAPPKPAPAVISVGEPALLPVPPPEPARAASPAPPKDPIAETADIEPLAREYVTPFKQPRAAPLPIAERLERHAAAGHTRIIDNDEHGETLPFDDPFEVMLEPHLLTMTVESYASLCAECIVSPLDRAEIHRRYDVGGESERRALDAHWRGRLQNDRELAARFQSIYTDYEKWVRSRR